MWDCWLSAFCEDANSLSGFWMVEHSVENYSIMGMIYGVWYKPSVSIKVTKNGTTQKILQSENLKIVLSPHKYNKNQNNKT